MILVTIIACEKASIEVEEMQTVQNKEVLLAKGADKATICHYDDGLDEFGDYKSEPKWIKISISKKSMEAHKKHGDKYDWDGDGYYPENECGIMGEKDEYDCDDLDATVNPNADEIAYNGIDDDCNPLTLDEDGDFYNDIEGNEYKVVQIGNQIWMAENLRTTTYKDGTPVPNVVENSDWSNLSSPAYSWYENNYADYGETYGVLYNWHTVDTGKLAPEGWHIPSVEEWAILTNHVGGELVAGGKLKEIGFEHWNSPNIDATNEYGFTALGAGYRSKDGSFVHNKNESLWWASTPSPSSGSNGSWVYWMGNGTGQVYISAGADNRNYGYSIRCIKD